jgi:hypothetical protein
MKELKNVHEVEMQYSYGDVVRVVKYLEDPDGGQQLVSETVVESNGAFTRMVFDETGDLVETLRFDPSGKLLGRAPAGSVPEDGYYTL